MFLYLPIDSGEKLNVTF